MADTSGITSYFERLAGPEVQLKPSAMKNELNAAIHFIKFVKRTKNLAVTDPAFFATLENSREMISTFQEGTLNKINKDRNEKVSICH